MEMPDWIQGNGKIGPLKTFIIALRTAKDF
jgi:hypothetical protein